jgi:hypothetical protein
LVAGSYATLNVGALPCVTLFPVRFPNPSYVNPCPQLPFVAFAVDSRFNASYV